MALSDDLRQRVVDAVVSGGLSCHRAARHFRVSIASAVRWVEQYLTTGEISPKLAGGDRRSGRHYPVIDGRLRRNRQPSASICVGVRKKPESPDMWNIVWNEMPQGLMSPPSS